MIRRELHSELIYLLILVNGVLSAWIALRAGIAGHTDPTPKFEVEKITASFFLYRLKIENLEVTWPWREGSGREGLVIRK
jgi:hypothetical protein